MQDTAHIAVSSVLQMAYNTIDGETLHIQLPLTLGLYAGLFDKRLVRATDHTMQLFAQNVANPM